MEFAGGFPSALAGVLFGRLTDIVFTELGKMKGAKKELQELEVTVYEARRMLGQLNLWQCEYKYNDMHLLQSRVETLTNLCYDAEDLIDRVAIDIANRNKWPTIMFSTIPSAIVKLHGQIIRIKEQLVILTEDVGNGNCTLNLQPSRRRWNISSRPKDLVGRDNDVEKIYEELISCQSHMGVSIVGMHGVGKTALAETILSHPRIAEKFPLRIEILVSNGFFDYDIAIRDLEEYFLLCKKDKGTLANDNLLIMFNNLLWIKDKDLWNQLWSTINCSGIADVKMLITTLNPSVSQLIGTKAYDLGPLPPEDPKIVIMNTALQHMHNQYSSHPVFEQIAELLGRKYEGLPVVAKAIGHIMAVLDESKWALLTETDLWELASFRRFILPILQSSLINMHPASKLCFAYFSLFPKNYQFNIDNLVQLWAGEGFFPLGNDSSTLEQTVSICLDDLRVRSILQCSDEEKNKVYKLPSFIHQFAQFIASGRCLLFDGAGKATLTKKTRHVSLLCANDQSSIWSKPKILKQLRTILSLQKDDRSTGLMVQIPNHIFRKLEYLRVLAFNGTNVVCLPECIKKLILLCYIDVSSTRINMLPEGLSALSNLHFLNVKRTPELKILPQKFHRLTNLVRLDWDVEDIKRLGLPANVGKLHNLETLPLFCVEDKIGFLIGELGNMNRLQGSICIMGLENVKDGDQAKQANLHEKLSLARIELKWNAIQNDTIAAAVLEALKPHNFLQGLKINGYGTNLFPAWISDPTFNLRELHLYECQCSSLPALGQLKALKVLVLEGIRCLVQVDERFCGTLQDTRDGYFTSLELLAFYDMSELKCWIGLGKKDMPSVRDLRLINCPKLTVLPSLQYLESLENLEIKDCPYLETLPNLPKSLSSLVIGELPTAIDSQYNQDLTCIRDTGELHHQSSSCRLYRIFVIVLLTILHIWAQEYS